MLFVPMPIILDTDDQTLRKVSDPHEGVALHQIVMDVVT